MGKHIPEGLTFTKNIFVDKKRKKQYLRIRVPYPQGELTTKAILKEVLQEKGWVWVKQTCHFTDLSQPVPRNGQKCLVFEKRLKEK